jgi:nitrogen fixation protein FixH
VGKFSESKYTAWTGDIVENSLTSSRYFARKTKAVHFLL